MYRFPGRSDEEGAIVTKVRVDDETGADCYDVKHRYMDVAYKWISRHHLKIAVEDGVDMAVMNMEVKWRRQIKKKYENDERKAKKDKEEAIKRELERLDKMKSMTYILTGHVSEENTVNSHTLLMRARVSRIQAEAREIKALTEDMEAMERRDTAREEVNAINAASGNKLTRADILAMTRSMEMKMALEAKIEKRNLLQEKMNVVAEGAKRKAQFIEDGLRDEETMMTTPRSLERRRVVRNMHIAITRQNDNFIICEWGCGEWFRVGKEQDDHKLYKCCKRIIGCTLDCPLKHSEEYWLTEHVTVDKTMEGMRPETAGLNVGQEMDLLFTHQPISRPQTTAGAPNKGDQDEKVRVMDMSEEDEGRKGEEKDADEYDDVFKPRPKTAMTGITNQQWHETEECPKRLVVCPMNCLEWVVFEKLPHHMEHLCTKRPAEPLVCRLGCNALFGGSVEKLIQAEEERLEHETEQCELRLVRCSWKFEDGRMCAAQLKACDRPEHRDYHLNLLGVVTYQVPGTYIYKVPRKLTRLYTLYTLYAL